MKRWVYQKQLKGFVRMSKVEKVYKKFRNFKTVCWYLGKYKKCVKSWGSVQKVPKFVTVWEIDEKLCQNWEIMIIVTKSDKVWENEPKDET